LWVLKRLFTCPQERTLKWVYWKVLSVGFNTKPSTDGFSLGLWGFCAKPICCVLWRRG